MTRYILEIEGKDEERLINHLAIELEILQNRVLDFNYSFEEDKEKKEEQKEKKRWWWRKKK